ncbi:MAG: hypothetical protein KatS3mg105_4465 [Gemmatales bacterium]|nr:MAG: hypothetical protein KatS3mg105_4465 [Gemmatales bacterium]
MFYPDKRGGMKVRHSLISTTFLCVVALFLPGCGKGEVTIKGKLLRDGKPIQVDGSTYVTVMFAAEPQGKSFAATFDHKTSQYEVRLPPGKYRSIVHVMDGTTQAPPPPGKGGTKVYEFTANQELDLEVP